MAEDDRRFGDFKSIQHCLLGDMSKINQHTKAIHLQDNIFTECAQSIASYWIPCIDLKFFVEGF